MTQYETLRYEVADGILTLTLNRPEQLNAFTVQMADDLEHAFRRVNDDDDVRAVVVTGEGRSFCAGMDLSVGGNVFGLNEDERPTPADMETRFDDADFASCTSPHEPADALADGDHALDVRVVDAAGNTSTASHAFLIDTVAPDIEIAAVASPTSDRTPTFTFTVAGAPSAVECRFDAAAD